MAALDYYDIVFFGVAICIVFFLLIGVFCFNYWLMNRKDSPSPYTGQPLRRASDLSYYNMERVLRYLYEMHLYDNRILDFSKAAVCRETGRIFTDCITWFDRIEVNWNFLQKRLEGNYVSWGSLTEAQQEIIMNAHHAIEGFQTENSCPIASPRLITKEYAYLKPGPLYVDMDKKILIGWKCVPDTNLEVLIVQRPRGIFEPPIR
jgi:hypothetical protein